MKFVLACDIAAPFGDASMFVLTRVDCRGITVLKHWRRIPWWVRAGIRLGLITAIAEKNEPYPTFEELYGVTKETRE